MMKVRIIEKRAKEVFRIINDLWAQKAPIFEGVVLPQDRHVLKDCSEKDIANFLFFTAIPMRGAVNSDDPFKLMYHLFMTYPEMFSPEIAAKEWSQKDIVGAIRKVSLQLKMKNPASQENGCVLEENGGALGYKLEEHAKHWHENAVILSKFWGGNILNVYRYGISDYEDAFRKIDNEKTPAGFVGMRRKIFALLTIWLQEKKLIPVFPTPLPVDFHALRILWATECISLPKSDESHKETAAEHYPALIGKPVMRISETLINQITIWSQKFITAEGFSTFNINPALWVISRDLCSGQLQNQSRGGGSGTGTQRFIATKFFAKEELLQNPNAWPKSYNDPCSFCPLNDLCTGAIPSNPYYRKGLFVRLERATYPNVIMPGMEDYLSFLGRRRSVLNKEE